MKIRTIKLVGFKRFHNLKIDLGSQPKKVVALVGPNGCGKSSIFDAFEVYSIGIKPPRNRKGDDFYSKAVYSPGIDGKYSHKTAVQIEMYPKSTQITKKSFVVRSSYRYTSSINMTKVEQKTDILEDDRRPGSSVDLDSRLSDNYERLVAQLLASFDEGSKTGNEIRNEIIGKINESLSSVLDIEISSLGSIMEPNQGRLFFSKGTSKKLPYDNLSSGEKEVVDLIIDLVVREKSYDDTVYCIDEPELHLNTSIQRKLLVEIVKLIPEGNQLWIATHSLGFLRALQDELSNEAQIIDFSEKEIDFDLKVELRPIKPTRSKWLSIFSTALEDLTGLVGPELLIYCEGKIDAGPNGEEHGLDAQVYNNIFGEHRHDAYFVSSGGSTQPDIYSAIAIKVLSKALRDVNILLLKDKDIHGSGAETTYDDRELWLRQQTFHRMLKRKEIENYLFDYEVVVRIAPTLSIEEHQSIVGNCKTDDVKKHASKLKTACGINNEMSNEEFKIHLSKKFTTDMEVYKELFSCIFESVKITAKQG
ncbi:MAG: ATP-binding protein [Chlamydiales bacterium]|nr:ATP-binding protein [Chlamydiales bacterium]